MKAARIGIVGRFRPLHNGSAAVLERICEEAQEAIIGIGSSNRYNARNPYTAQETREMIEAYLSPRYSNFSIVEVPDFGHDPQYRDGQRWREEVKEKFGKLDAFVSGNGYVQRLLADDYAIIVPHTLIPKERQVFLSGSMVRHAMAYGEGWETLVPTIVAAYIKDGKLDGRFRQEFGLETIAQTASYDPTSAHHEENEKQNVWKP